MRKEKLVLFHCESTLGSVGIKDFDLCKLEEF